MLYQDQCHVDVWRQLPKELSEGFEPARRGTNAHNWEGLIHRRVVVNTLWLPMRCRLYWSEPASLTTGGALCFAPRSLAVDEFLGHTESALGYFSPLA